MLIEKTTNTPYVNLSVEDCIFEIIGNSYSDDISEFFDKIIDWVENEMPKISCEIECKFYFHVFNSVTYKTILYLMRKFCEIQDQGKKITILWIYFFEDSDSREVGEDLRDIFEIPVIVQQTKTNILKLYL